MQSNEFTAKADTDTGVGTRPHGSSVFGKWNRYFLKPDPRVDKSEYKSLCFRVDGAICIYFFNYDVIPHVDLSQTPLHHVRATMVCIQRARFMHMLQFFFFIFSISLWQNYSATYSSGMYTTFFFSRFHWTQIFLDMTPCGLDCFLERGKKRSDWGKLQLRVDVAWESSRYSGIPWPALIWLQRLWSSLHIISTHSL